MSHNFAVVGAGWYGCHIALSLRALGFGVTVFEQEAKPLAGASGNNQFRLHQGFHYPRHYETRLQSREGYSLFVERYEHLPLPVDENVYVVPRDHSQIDFPTYRLIMTASGIDFMEVECCSVPLSGVEGMMLTSERVVRLAHARQYFASQLNKDLMLGAKVDSIEEDETGVWVHGQRFDYLVDATWGHLVRLPIPVWYEPTLLLYYESEGACPALTFVDGPLCSIYPTEEATLFTLSSVPHTPLGRFDSAAAGYAALASFTTVDLAAKAKAMEMQISAYLPDFADRFRFAGPQLSMKTKPIGGSSNRSCYVFREGRVFLVMSGKIDTIFHAVNQILLSLQTPPPRGSTSAQIESNRSTSTLASDHWDQQ